MKTGTYLRLSLLIPILIWGLCVLVVIILSASLRNELAFNPLTSLPDFIFLFLMFYALGIILWFLPYLLLSVLLLVLSYRVQARVMIKVFALSPIAMTIVMIIIMNLLMRNPSPDGSMLSSPLIKDQDVLSFDGLILAFSLLWGYICVGAGFGLYTLLQHFQIIRDEANLEPASKLINQYE